MQRLAAVSGLQPRRRVQLLFGRGDRACERLFALRGSERLELLPVGRETRAALAGDWPSPRFQGAYLPERREVRADGFSADWRVSALARTFPGKWRWSDWPHDLEQSAFGTELVLPVDGYQRTERALKYGLLVVVLTFLAFFLFEIGSELRLHVVQYGLVGAALCVFYLLLLSLSEHLGFAVAYLSAAAATVGLISAYVTAILRGGRRAAAFAGLLAGLYGGLYALIEWTFLYPLTPLGGELFAFPDYGLYHGERLEFHRDPIGAVKEVVAAGIVFPRRAVGAVFGGTFRIRPVKQEPELRAIVAQSKPPENKGADLQPDLVDLMLLDPSLRFDIRYATTNNFMGMAFYPEARAFLQRPAAEALLRVHNSLKSRGYGLLIHDAYRPWSVTKMFWEATPEDMKHFVANPDVGSIHNRGAAVDLTLYDLETGAPLEMPGGYDEFSARSYPDYMGGTSAQRWRRELLRDAMEAEGFTVYPYEWWHFNYKDAERYPILNLEHSAVQASR